MPALNSSMLKMIFCILISLLCYRKGLSLISRGGLSVFWSLVSFTKKINSEGFLHLLLLSLDSKGIPAFPDLTGLQALYR